MLKTLQIINYLKSQGMNKDMIMEDKYVPEQQGCNVMQSNVE